MTLSFVLRLRDDRLAAGELVGQAENVQTGEQQTIVDVAGLLAFIHRTASEVSGERPGRS